tara:strand:+ start:197 stop:517 length:321 start_codon:yes stop_codon:yes gene_type:complete
MPLYSKNINIREVISTIAKLNKDLTKANKKIKYYETKLILLEKEITKLNHNKNNIFSHNNISNIAKLSKNNFTKKHPKSFSNLATYLDLEKCSLIHEILTDDEEDE